MIIVFFIGLFFLTCMAIGALLGILVGGYDVIKTICFCLRGK